MELSFRLAPLVVVVILASCGGARSGSANLIADKFRDVINRHGAPLAMRDADFDGHQRFNPLFDDGAWMGICCRTDSKVWADFPARRCLRKSISTSWRITLTA